MLQNYYVTNFSNMSWKIRDICPGSSQNPLSVSRAKKIWRTVGLVRENAPTIIRAQVQIFFTHDSKLVHSEDARQIKSASCQNSSHTKIQGKFYIKLCLFSPLSMSRLKPKGKCSEWLGYQVEAISVQHR